MSGMNIQICHYHKSVSQFKMTNIVMRSNEFNYILYRKGPLWPLSASKTKEEKKCR